jgi:hypothetical protein
VLWLNLEVNNPARHQWEYRKYTYTFYFINISQYFIYKITNVTINILENGHLYFFHHAYKVLINFYPMDMCFTHMWPSADPNQPAHLCSLIMVSAVCLYSCVYNYIIYGSKYIIYDRNTYSVIHVGKTICRQRLIYT